MSIFRQAVCLGALVLTSAPAAAQVMCGDTITGSATLTENLFCGDPTGGPGVVIDGGALNMNGFFIDCTGITTGVSLGGTGARLFNGTVRNCGGPGVAGGTGVSVSGEDNVVSNVTSENHVGFGFQIVMGSGHRLVRVTGDGNGGNGLLLADGSSNSVVRGSTFTNNGSDGIILTPGSSGHRFLRNRTEGNGTINNNSAGIRVRGAGHLFIGNQASSNVANNADGFSLNASADDTVLLFNRANDNAGTGFQVANGSTGNRIVGNRALGNGAFDFSDGNPDCDDNTYRFNTFGTQSSDTGCIR